MTNSTGPQFREERVVNITGAVTSRKIYLNQQGMDMIADLRRYFEDEFYGRTGQEIKLSMPALVHTIMSEFIKMKEENGITINGIGRQINDD